MSIWQSINKMARLIMIARSRIDTIRLEQLASNIKPLTAGEDKVVF